VTRTAMQAIDVAGPVFGAASHVGAERIVPKRLAPSQCHRRPSGAQLLIEGRSKTVLASTARPAWKQLADTGDKTVVPTMS
jgi:hypothetical protein